MDTVCDVIQRKAGRLVCTAPSATVRQATRLMNDHGIGSLLVTNRGRLVGIFTERDVLRRIVADGRSPDQTLVADVMTTDVVCCSPETTVEELAGVMRRRRVRHVPILDAQQALVGVVSIGDINAHRFHACATELVQVRDYIMGRT